MSNTNRARTGYTEDVAPERALTGLPGTPVPRSEEGGSQRGVLPVSQRKYIPGRFKAVSMAEAEALLAARRAGEAAIIKSYEPNTEVDDSTTNYGDTLRPAESTVQPQIDVASVAGDIETAVEDAVSGGDVGGLTTLISKLLAERSKPAPPPRPPHPAEAYFNRRKQVSLQLPGVTLRTSAIDVVVCAFGVGLILPLDGNTFVPDPGAEVTLTFDGESIDCFYPGVNFDLAELGATVLSFVKK